MGFSILVFRRVRGSYLATSNEKPECDKNPGFFIFFYGSVNGPYIILPAWDHAKQAYH